MAKSASKWEYSQAGVYVASRIDPGWADRFLNEHRALMVAVTGGIGCGKTQVTEILFRFGAKTCSADQFAAQALVDLAPRLAIVFDRPNWAETGVDRAELASIVFSNPVARRKLESITHPYIAFLADRHFGQLQPGEIGIYDVPLLAEKVFLPEQGEPGDGCAEEDVLGGRPEADNSDGVAIPVGYDIVLTVVAPLEQRIERLAARSQLTQEQVMARIRAQASDQERKKIAHYVISNQEDTRKLQRLLASELWPNLLDLAEGLVPDELR